MFWQSLSFNMDSVFHRDTETSKKTFHFWPGHVKRWRWSLTVMSNGYRTLSQHLNDLKKENFSLKLRIYFLEERIQQKYEESSEDVYRTVSKASVIEREGVNGNLSDWWWMELQVMWGAALQGSKGRFTATKIIKTHWICFAVGCDTE